MKQSRFFCPELSSDEVVLDASESHHLAHVLRLQVGQRVELFDGAGKTARAEIVAIGKRGVHVKIEEIAFSCRPASQIVLAVSLAKSQRFDFLVEKCTELGVDHIIAVVFGRTVKLGKEMSIERYRKITISAAKQSGCPFLPKLSGPWSLQKTMEYLRIDYPHAFWLYGDICSQFSCEKSPEQLTAMTAGKDVLCLIGPEGGFTQEEKDLFKSVGICPIRLNPNTLRIETAAVAFGALFSFLRK